MGRRAIALDIDKLRLAVKEAEAAQKFPNQNKLFEFIAPQFGVAPIIVRDRVIKNGIELLTPKGKRGRQAGFALVKQGRVSGGRKKVGENYQKALRAKFEKLNHQFMLDNDGRGISGLKEKVEKACNGSVKAAVWLNCLDCNAGEKSLIKTCTITSCPMYAFRPYKNKEEKIKVI